MAFVRFSGVSYSSVGYDFAGPGVYEVTDEKKAQVLADFPDQFSDVIDGELVEDKAVEEVPAEAEEAPAEPVIEAVEEDKAPKKGGK